MIVVSDTSPLTNLMKIDGLPLMKAVFGHIVIPPMVETELNRIPYNGSSMKPNFT